MGDIGHVRREIMYLVCNYGLQICGVIIMGPAWYVGWRVVNSLAYNSFDEAWTMMAFLVPLQFFPELILWFTPVPPPPVEPRFVEILWALLTFDV